jgi:GNAT superfamily N-acetyltransferase
MPIPITLLATQHVRGGFDCGDSALNDFLQRQSGQLARKGYGKTYVALAADGITVLGFVTLSVGQVETDQLPGTLKLPHHPAPVLRIGRLAVDRTAQGQGVGQQLMAFALQLSLEFSQQVALYAVIVDAKHEQAKAFYIALGFKATLDDPLCLYLPLATLKALR